MTWRKLCSESELADSAQIVTDIDGTPIVAVWRNGDPRAFYDLCSHQAVPLSAFGEIVDDSIICHAHGAMFSLADGSVEREPACEALRSYPLKREAGSVWVAWDADS